MFRKFLVPLALAVSALASFAQSTAPNPFKPPSAGPSTAPAPLLPPATLPHGTAQGVPLPPPVPTNVGPNGMPVAVGVSNGAVPALPLPDGSIAPTPPEKDVEEFSAVRVGKVNGKNIYRGDQGGYHFEADSKKKPERKVVKSTHQRPLLPAPAGATPNGQARPDLPSMVGKPAPTR